MKIFSLISHIQKLYNFCKYIFSKKKKNLSSKVPKNKGLS